MRRSANASAHLGILAILMKNVDLAVIVALKEEFIHLFERIRARPYTIRTIGGIDYFECSISQSTDQKEAYSCVAVLVGEMGGIRTSTAVAHLFGAWDVTTVCIVGLAGSMDSDVMLGDLVIATTIDNYLESGKVLGDDTPLLSLSGDVYRASESIVARTRTWQFSHLQSFEGWQRETRQHRSEALGATGAAEDHLRSEPMIWHGHLASGPIVVDSAVFRRRLLERRDRKFLAVEMESGGLAVAVHVLKPTSNILVVRGISDDAQDKAEIDRAWAGSIRAYAMRNAVSLLWAFASSGILPSQRRGPSLEQIESALRAGKIEDARRLLRAVPKDQALPRHHFLRGILYLCDVPLVRADALSRSRAETELQAAIAGDSDLDAPRVALALIELDCYRYHGRTAPFDLPKITTLTEEDRSLLNAWQVRSSSLAALGLES